MSGKFRCFAVTELFKYEYAPGQENIFPLWKREFTYATKEMKLEGYTGIAIFGPNQESFLNIFLDKPKYKILYKSKKCVNPNYKSDNGRNTIVIFEEGEK